jgi:hypothetical protein
VFGILYVFFWVFPRRLIVVWRRFGTLYQSHLHGLNTLHPALEAGTDRGFRNVGKQQSDAGETPKRIHTRFQTRRKFEIKNNLYMFRAQVLIVWRAKLYYTVGTIICILWGISPASDCGLPTFRNPLSVPSSRAGCKVFSP